VEGHFEWVQNQKAFTAEGAENSNRTTEGADTRGRRGQPRSSYYWQPGVGANPGCLGFFLIRFLSATNVKERKVLLFFWRSVVLCALCALCGFVVAVLAPSVVNATLSAANYHV
jgi:hypothetical protein